MSVSFSVVLSRVGRDLSVEPIPHPRSPIKIFKRIHSLRNYMTKALCLDATGSAFPAGKATEREDDHSHRFSAEVKNVRSCTSIYLHGVVLSYALGQQFKGRNPSNEK
jgi:hypothetical protein